MHMLSSNRLFFGHVQDISYNLVPLNPASYAYFHLPPLLNATPTTSVLFYYTIVEFLPISDIHNNIIALITTSTHHTQVELT